MPRPDGMDHSQKFMLIYTNITLSSIDTQRQTGTFQCLTTARLVLCQLPQSRQSGPGTPAQANRMHYVAYFASVSCSGMSDAAQLANAHHGLERTCMPNTKMSHDTSTTFSDAAVAS